MAGDSWVVASGLQGSDAGHREIEADMYGNIYVAATVQTDTGRLSLAKYSPESALLWRNELVTGDGQTVWDAAVAADGVYVVGEFGGTVDFDPHSPVGNMQSQGASDGYVVKYSVDGTFQWARQFGGAQLEYLRSVEVQDGGVYITGHLTTTVNRKSTRSDLFVAKLSSDGEELWRREIPNGWGHGIAVYKPTTEPATIYVTGDGYNYPDLGPVTLPSCFVMSMSESTDGRDVATEWVVGVGTRVGRLAVTTEAVTTEVDGEIRQVPRLYVPSYAGGGDLLKLDETGSVLWSQHVTSDSLSLWDVAVDDNVVYLAGGFGGSADFDQEASNPVLTSRGIKDGFLARYDTVDGHLLALQRMGGNNVYQDAWSGLDVVNGLAYLSGRFSGPVVDFPIGLANQMSAFVPTTTIKELFTLQLDTAAPIVQVEDTDITVSEGTSVTLNATPIIGSTITWYKSGVPLHDTTVDTQSITLTLLPGMHQISAIATDTVTGRIGMAGVVVTVAAAAPSTKFYVVDDSSANKTFEYDANGSPVESYSLNTGNTAPRGAASTAAGDTTWVVDANRNVYAYNTSGGLLRSWTAGTLNSKSVVEGIATNGTDVWIVDAKTDKVYRYANGAAALSGTLTAASSFSLNSGNVSPKDIVTDGTYLWVVNDSTTDAVFKYSMTGAYQGSWTISGGGGSPTGITLDPSNASQDLWIVDSGTDNVYQYTDGRSFTSGTITATKIFDLAVGNTNPQGIADPPAPGSLLTTETPVLSEPLSAEVALGGDDVALASMYYEPLKNVRVDIAQRSESRIVESHTLDVSFTVGAAPNYLTDDNRWANDNDGQSDVDDLFAQWESDPLELFSFPDHGV
ncbi:MAG: NHL repeat-containing protein [Acidobacteriaceae bacterium]